MTKEFEDEVYIIPHNYTDNGKIFGMFEKQSAYLAGGWFAPAAFLNFKVLPFSIDVKLFTLILFVLPVAILLLIGIGGEPISDFIKYVIKFKKNARVYHYEK